MAESKVRDENFFMVNGWMLNRLNLKGTALHVFAIIYGFSQDGEGSFTGSLHYLCDFTNTTKKPVIKALKELTDKGYVIKTENTINGVKFNTYKTSPLVVEKLHRGSGENTLGGSGDTPPGGSGETPPNNKSLDNKSLISKEKVKEVIDLYHSICISFPKVKVISAARKKTILERLETYSLEDLKTVFGNAESSSFLKGKNDRNWQANFDWLIADKNIVKVLEGNYADRGRKEAVPGWMEKRELGEYEIAAIHAMMNGDTDRMLFGEQEDVPEVNIGNSPDLAERAERLRREFGGK